MQSRSNSTATSNKTLIGSDSGGHNPWDGVASPIIQTPDQRQWIDLELLNPKFLKGLSQYAESDKDGPNSRFGRSAAKIKAWARQSKAGIDIRLRRKIDSEKDEITDIRLVPDTYPSSVSDYAGKPSTMQELPAIQSFAELADTTISPATELDATRIGQPSRSSTSSTIGEPLPRYEREPESILSDVASTSMETPGESQVTKPENGTLPIAGSGHRPSTSQSSIVGTPTRGLSVRDNPDSPPVQAAKDEHELYATHLKADLEDAQKRLDEQRQLSESLQAVIDALGDERPRAQADGPADSTEDQKARHARLRRLRVADRTTYETETDLESPSAPNRSRRKAPVSALRKKRDPLADTKEPLSDTSEALIRKQTLPRRVPASAGVEAVWRSLMYMQTILFGPDHQLTVRARSAQRSWRHSNSERPIDLSALERSKVIAERHFGIEHPWVAAFCEDLTRLAKLSGPSMFANTDEEPATPNTPLDGASDESLPPSTPEVMVTVTSESDRSVERSLHKIDTSVKEQPADKEPSPIVGGLEIESHLDMLWNTSRSPHQPQNRLLSFLKLSFAAASRVAWSGVQWLQTNYGPEQPVEPGKTRVRWTCSCGEKLHDDFVERRPGAARALEAYLNRPKGAVRAPSSKRPAQNSKFGRWRPRQLAH